MNKSMVSSKWEGISTILYPVLFGVFVFVLWQTQTLNRLFGTSTNTLPLPTKIVSIIFDNIPKILENLQSTLIVAVGGLVLGSILGYIIAMIATIFPKWGAGGLSLVAAFNAVPIVALAPVMNNLTKRVSEDADFRSMIAKMLVVMIFCTASMSINAYRGLTELRPFSNDLMKTYGANSITVFLKLRFPNSIPYIFTALRVSLPGSIIGALVTEYFAEKVIGIGRQIRENIVTAQYPSAWSYIMVACAVGIGLYCILLVVESLTVGKRAHQK